MNKEQREKLLKPELTLKPSIWNALGPTFLKNFVYILVGVIIISAITYLVHIVGLISFNILENVWVNLSIMFLVSAIIAIVPLSVEIFMLSNTKYYFYKTHLSKEFVFIKIIKDSMPYRQIVNVSTEITFWDRICNAGDIVISSAEDNHPDLVLKFIKNPEVVEHTVYGMMHKIKPGIKETPTKIN